MKQCTSTNLKGNKMTNKQMYVITMATGSYDSYSVGVVAVTEDFVKGETYVNKKNADYQSMEKKLKTVFDLAMRDWEIIHPRPAVSEKNLIKVPKWNSAQKITIEMRKEREEIEVKNQEIHRQSYEPLQKWSKEFFQQRENWVQTHLNEDEQEVYKIRDHNYWEIEEVNWL